jgi:hypothetical protein
MKDGAKILTIDEILTAQDLETQEVEMQEWGGAVVVRGLSLDDVMMIREKAMVRGEVDPAVSTQLTLVAGLHEPRITPEQAAALSKKSAAALTRVLTAINSLSGLTPEAMKASEKSFRA